MNRVRRTVVNALVVALAAPLAAASPFSSHREAPAIAGMPKVDATDFYMFRSYEAGKDAFVTLIADYLPLQAPYGGPNYFTLDPDARYEIKIDNDGDAVEDFTFRFQFHNSLQDVQLAVGPNGNQKMVSIPLVNAAPISAADDSGLNVKESFTLDLIMKQGKKTVTVPVLDADTQSATFVKPVDNIGTKSIPDYAAYAAAHVYNIALPGGATGRLFVGQRKDPFVVNLGQAFDLVNLNPLGDPAGATDVLADANVTALELELPITFLVSDSGPVIGGWTTASLPKSRVFPKSNKVTFDQPDKESGKFAQVSRLGSPLVNELVIGVKDKDKFNASEPKDDAQFLDYVTNPTLPALLESLFGVTAPTQFPRTDLVQAFVTGLPGLNENGGVGEMLRLDTEIAPVAKGAQSNLGALTNDLAGFPNGRRPGDDVVDIALRVMMGVLLPIDVAPSGQLAYTDGAFLDDSFFDATFPYLLTPLAGNVSN